jgi:hypothetical protein
MTKIASPDAPKAYLDIITDKDDFNSCIVTAKVKRTNQKDEMEEEEYYQNYF